MAARRTVIIGSADANNLRDVVVRELTVGEVRDWLAEVECGAVTVDIVSGSVWQDLSLDDLPRMCDATLAELDAYAPSELETLVTACKEINRHFFLPRAEVARVMKEIAAAHRNTTATAAD